MQFTWFGVGLYLPHLSLQTLDGQTLVWEGYLLSSEVSQLCKGLLVLLCSSATWVV